MGAANSAGEAMSLITAPKKKYNALWRPRQSCLHNASQILRFNSFLASHEVLSLVANVSEVLLYTASILSLISGTVLSVFLSFTSSDFLNEAVIALRIHSRIYL